MFVQAQGVKNNCSEEHLFSLQHFSLLLCLLLLPSLMLGGSLCGSCLIIFCAPLLKSPFHVSAPATFWEVRNVVHPILERCTGILAICLTNGHWGFPMQVLEIVLGLAFLAWVLDPGVDKFPCVLLWLHL